MIVKAVVIIIVDVLGIITINYFSAVVLLVVTAILKNIVLVHYIIMIKIIFLLRLARSHRYLLLVIWDVHTCGTAFTVEIFNVFHALLIILSCHIAMSHSILILTFSLFIWVITFLIRAAFILR